MTSVVSPPPSSSQRQHPHQHHHPTDAVIVQGIDQVLADQNESILFAMSASSSRSFGTNSCGSIDLLPLPAAVSQHPQKQPLHHIRRGARRQHLAQHESADHHSVSSSSWVSAEVRAVPWGVAVKIVRRINKDANSSIDTKTPKNLTKEEDENSSDHTSKDSTSSNHEENPKLDNKNKVDTNNKTTTVRPDSNHTPQNRMSQPLSDKNHSSNSPRLSHYRGQVSMKRQRIQTLKQNSLRGETKLDKNNK